MLGIGFNPRTHTGCDAEISGRIEALSEFQSTHPHGVRHYELKVTDGDAVFQSTHPHGVRPIALSSISSVIAFQSTHPHGVRRLRMRTANNQLAVSIHAPTRGATRVNDTFCAYKEIVSIHAPTRGATFNYTNKNTARLCFNPRTHTGCDTKAVNKEE